MNMPIAYWNGKIVPEVEARLPVWDLGVVNGAAVTEMIRTFQHVPFRLEAHLDRLAASIERLRFATCPDRGEILQAVEQIVTTNSRLIPSDHDLGIVVFVTAGQNLTYLGHAARPTKGRGTVCVHSFPLPFELWTDRLKTGQRLVIPKLRQPAAETLPPEVKFRSRLHWFLADQQARDRDPDAAALILDERGFLTETSFGNLFIASEGRILTPKSGSVLNGISRQMVLDLARELGIPFGEEDLSVSQLMQADEAFLSSTPCCLLPVATVDQCPIGSPPHFPVFEQFVAAWSAQVELDIIHQIHLGAQQRISFGSP